MKKVLKLIQYLVYTVLVLGMLLLLGTRIGLPGQVQLLVVQSGSMEPTIKTGDAILISKSEDYNVGDVITFSGLSGSESLTTHRIVNVEFENEQPFYTTKGDANNSADKEKVLYTNVMGKMNFYLPYAGYAIEKIKTPIGFAAFVIIPSLVVIYSEILKIAKVIDQKRKNKIVEKLISEEDAKVS